MEKTINQEHYFYVNNGEILKNLNDLLECIKIIDPTTFSHHFNSEKNDFYNWTRDVLKDTVLAKQLLKSKTREEMIKSIEQRLIKKSKSSGNQNKKLKIFQIKKAITNG